MLLLPQILWTEPSRGSVASVATIAATSAHLAMGPKKIVGRGSRPLLGGSGGSQRVRDRYAPCRPKNHPTEHSHRYLRLVNFVLEHRRMGQLDSTILGLLETTDVVKIDGKNYYLFSKSTHYKYAEMGHPMDFTFGPFYDESDSADDEDAGAGGLGSAGGSDASVADSTTSAAT